MRIDDLKPGDLLVGPSKTMTDAHFLFFSGLTGDTHPVHYDVEYARRTRFGRPVTHGLLLASMTALGALPGTHELEGFAFVEQGCRFLRPVFVGDTADLDRGDRGGAAPRGRPDRDRGCGRAPAVRR